MSFLNPILLLGLAGVIVPVVIHLLNRRKYQPMPWAAMRFLRVSVATNRRRMRIEDWLLLLIRCAIVAVVAVTLARPALRGSSDSLLGRSGVTAVIVLDNSYSMSHTDGVASRFDQAKLAAARIVDSLPRGSRAALILASDIPDAVIPQPTSDLNLVGQSIAHGQTTDRGTALLASLKTTAATGIAPQELYLITDGQAGGFEPFEDVVASLKGARSHIILVGQRDDRNLAITDIRPGAGVAATGRPTAFEVVVTNFGNAAASAVPVQLRIDAEAAGDSATIDQIPPGQSRTALLTARFKSDGYHSATASIPEDHLARDDQRTIALRSVSRVNVLLVDGQSISDPRDSATFFLRHALAPVANRDAADSFIKTTVIPAAALQSARLEDFDAVFLANVSDIPRAAAESLSAFVRRGGGLVIFPGPRTELESYNALSILPAKLAAAQDVQLTFSEKPSDHPIARAWGQGKALANVHFHRRLPLTPASEARTILAYSDGSPAIVDQSVGLGRVILFSSTADTQWNDLAVRPAVFVPLMQNALGSIVARGDESLNVRVGQPFIWHPGAEFSGRDALITRPGQTQPGDSQRIELGAAGASTMKYDDTDRAGRYEASVADPPARVVFAVQSDPAESNLASLSAQRLRRLSAVATVTDSSGTSTSVAAQGARDAAHGSELWFALTLAAIALAAVETFAAFRFSQPK